MELLGFVTTRNVRPADEAVRIRSSQHTAFEAAKIKVVREDLKDEGYEESWLSNSDRYCVSESLSFGLRRVYKSPTAALAALSMVGNGLDEQYPAAI